MTHPYCCHECTSNCRRNGCNCECGEWHDSLDQYELDEVLAEIEESKAQEEGEAMSDFSRGN